LLAEDKKDLSEKIRKIKGASSFNFNRQNKLPKGSRLWARRFDFKLITTNDQYINTCRYIETNDTHHIERWN
ncbi:transposase, partial [bacterium]|nr:transposase [bacterium]MBU1026047.1 transposase [bacterium]